MKIDRDLIDKGYNLRILARYGIGLDNVDIDYAIKKGIAVINAPNASTISVAELTIGLMIMIFRNLYNHIEHVKRGLWPKGKFIGRELYGKNLGIVGYGRIGGRVAYYGRALGMNVYVYDIRDVKNDVEKIGGKQVEFDELLEVSDVISLHVPLTPLTYHMINNNVLNRVKDGCVIVNTSRGEVIDTYALIKHLDRLGGVALDVLEQEPPKDEILFQLIRHPKVIVTPHIGAETIEAMDRIADELYNSIMEAIDWL